MRGARHQPGAKGWEFSRARRERNDHPLKAAKKKQKPPACLWACEWISGLQLTNQVIHQKRSNCRTGEITCSSGRNVLRAKNSQTQLADNTHTHTPPPIKKNKGSAQQQYIKNKRDVSFSSPAQAVPRFTFYSCVICLSRRRCCHHPPSRAPPLVGRPRASSPGSPSPGSTGRAPPTPPCCRAVIGEPAAGIPGPSRRRGEKTGTYRRRKEGTGGLKRGHPGKERGESQLCQQDEPEFRERETERNGQEKALLVSAWIPPRLDPYYRFWLCPLRISPAAAATTRCFVTAGADVGYTRHAARWRAGANARADCWLKGPTVLSVACSFMRGGIQATLLPSPEAHFRLPSGAKAKFGADSKTQIKSVGYPEGRSYHREGDRDTPWRSSSWTWRPGPSP